jgi:hypothetical protein
MLNQNECWEGRIDPPLTGSEKLVLKWRSKVIIVILPASTGRDNTNKNDVKNIWNQEWTWGTQNVDNS